LFCLALSVGLAGSVFARQATQAPPPTGPPGQVSGHVYRSDNNEPISRATVTLNPIGGRGVNVTPVVQTTRTDTGGAYAFPSVSPGNYVVMAQHSGFINELFQRGIAGNTPETLTVGPGETVSKIDVRLLSAAVISGTILDEDNQPLENATVAAVRIHYAKGGQQQEQPVKTVSTDDLGNFRLFGLPEGNYFVRVENRNMNFQTGEPNFRSAYYPGTATLESAQRIKAAAGAEAGGVRFSVGIQSTYTITGSVIDSSDSSGARRYIVSVIHLGDSETFSVANQPTNDGSFTIHGVPSGEYMLQARSIQVGQPGPSGGPNGGAQGGQRQNSGATMIRVADADARANIQISSAAEVNGKVVIENSTGLSVNGIRVQLQSQSLPNGIGGSNFNIGTDQNGAFKIPGVVSGSYVISAGGRGGTYLKQAVCGGRDYTIQPLTIDSGATVGDCVLTLAADTGTIKGQVYDSDRPVPDLVVIAIPQSMALRRLARYTQTGNTNANGEFQISGMIPGDYLVFAVPKDDEQSYFQLEFADRNQRDAERVSVKSADTKIVTLKPTTLQ
jgi:hypothetical protein